MSVSLSSAPDSSAIAARCTHFGHCGGCSLQNISYPDQLLRKRGIIEELLSPLDVEISAIHGSPELWYYRNKMEFSFGNADGTARLGLKVRRRWFETLDLSECFLLSSETPALLDSVRRWAAAEKLSAFDARRNFGFLRHLVVRESKNGKDRLVSLITSPGELPKSFVAAVLSSYPATSILWGVNAKPSDTAVPDSIEMLAGPSAIFETLRPGGREINLRISAASFFQTNTAAAEVLYGLLRSWACELRPQLALDLYCGLGSIGLSLNDFCGRVIGVEQCPSSVADGKENAALNKASNVEFYEGDAGVLLPALLAMRPDLVIVDPPRCGIHPKALAALVQAKIPNLFYVSCNPKSLARDLEILSPAYKAVRAEAVDLFPHTDHVETAVRLRAI